MTAASAPPFITLSIHSLVSSAIPIFIHALRYTQSFSLSLSLLFAFFRVQYTCVRACVTPTRRRRTGKISSGRHVCTYVRRRVLNRVFKNAIFFSCMCSEQSDVSVLQWRVCFFSRPNLRKFYRNERSDFHTHSYYPDSRGNIIRSRYFRQVVFRFSEKRMKNITRKITLNNTRRNRLLRRYRYRFGIFETVYGYRNLTYSCKLYTYYGITSKKRLSILHYSEVINARNINATSDVILTILKKKKISKIVSLRFRIFRQSAYYTICFFFFYVRSKFIRS